MFTHKRGLKAESHLPSVDIGLHRVSANAAPPQTADWSQGVTGKQLGMLGNAEYSNCGPAGTEHGRDLKAAIKSDTGTPTWIEGFRLPHEPYTVALYEEYLKAMGWTGDPGVENSSWFLFLYNLTKNAPGTDVMAFAEWPLTTPRPSLLADAIVMRGMLVAVELDADYQKEWDQEVPFGTLSTTPDTSLGHDMYWSGYEVGDVTYITWSSYKKATVEWEANCVIERWGFFTYEESKELGVNWEHLTAVLDAETDLHPQLSQVDFAQVAHRMGSGLFDKFKNWIEEEVHGE